MFEIVSYEGQTYAELYYKTSENQIDLKPILIPKCGYSCPLERMYQLYANILPTKTFVEECTVASTNVVNDEK